MPGASSQIKALTIPELMAMVKTAILQQPALKNIYLRGEISKYTAHNSGHIYFSLVDKNATGSGGNVSLDCVFFANANKSLTFSPKEGMEVLLFGSIDTSPFRSSFQFKVQKMEELGSGAQLLQIQKLREKLRKEGLCDSSTKKPLPLLPRRLGIVTALTGAALRDILRQVKERYSHCEVLIAPAQVQGADAPRSIIAALAEISKEKWRCDVIIVGRGGGSPEDLMAFNDENLARAIAGCPVPVVSAVGHEIDHPISDDVADRASPTPTAAVRDVLPEIGKLAEKINQLAEKASHLLERKLSESGSRLQLLGQKPIFENPDTLYGGYWQLVDDLSDRLDESMRDSIENSRENLRRQSDPDFLFATCLGKFQLRYSGQKERLLAFSPLATLGRGYSITSQNGKVLQKLGQLDSSAKIQVRLEGGSFEAMPIAGSGKAD